MTKYLTQYCLHNSCIFITPCSLYHMTFLDCSVGQCYFEILKMKCLGSVYVIFTWGLLLSFCYCVLHCSLQICGACECQCTVTWNSKASFDSCSLTQASTGIHLPIAMVTCSFGRLRIVSQVSINTWHCHFCLSKDIHTFACIVDLIQSVNICSCSHTFNILLLFILIISQVCSIQNVEAEQQNSWKTRNGHFLFLYLHV